VDVRSRNLHINGERLLRDLAELSAIGGRPDGGIDRVAWSVADLEGRAWVRRRLEDMGWLADTDTALNVFGRSPRSRDRRLLVGSHTDSVAAGGRLDGALGVVAALEVARTLSEARDPTAEVVELVDFADEEGVGFPCGYFGSKALTGQLDLAALHANGDLEVLRAAGVEPERLGSASDRLANVAGYLELHIEQGPRLERENLEVAVATGILGFDRYQVVLTGRSDHGGTTPLDLRADPVLAAARFVSEVPALTASVDANGTATVGAMASEGGAINFVARQVRLTIEVRQPSLEALERTVQVVRDRLEAICESMGCRLSAFEKHVNAAEVKDGIPLAVEEAFAAPVAFNRDVVSACEQACSEVGARYRRMPAGTWHDAGIMAAHRPAAMLLVPSRDGITHSPRESTLDEHLIIGTNALLQAVRHAADALGLPAAHR
jgi:N-carbamoyl-L-amino-acid hydrolase